MVTREPVEVNAENEIVIGLITSKQFAEQILPVLKSEWLESDYAKIVCDWCKDYFKTYGKPPSKNIKDIFQTKALQEDDAKAELVSKFLKTISEKFEAEPDNPPYEADKALKYIERRALEVHVDNCQRHLEMGRYDKIETEIREFKKVEKLTSTWKSPFDKKFIRQVMLEQEDDILFEFPGAIGRMVGPEKRGYLTAILAKMKMGKSFWLMEMVIRAMFNRKRSVYFSFEMSEKQLEDRLIKRMLAFGKEGKEYIYPVFDCAKNQDGTCKSIARTNKVRLLDAGGNKPPYSNTMRYKPCTVCRGKKEYEVATWFMSQIRETPSTRKATKKMDGIKEMYGDIIRLKTFPAGSVNSAMIEAELDRLEYMEGFKADFLAIDYPKLMKPEYSGLNTSTEKIDATWIALKGLTQKRFLGIAAPHQSNRGGLEVKSLKQKHISGYIDVLAHVDKMYALSQTSKEKDVGVLRVSIIAHREEDFNEDRDVIVLQQRNVGQTLLDSEFAPRETDYKGKENDDEAND